MNKKKIIIIIIIFVLGISLLSYGISNYLLTNNENNTNTNNTNNNSETKNQNKTNEDNEPTSTEINGLLLDNFNVREDANIVFIKFSLDNYKDSTINNEELKINIYDNDQLLYTYSYKIENLESLNYIEIETDFMFEYTKITKYEMQFEGYKKEIKPLEKKDS